MLNLKTSSQSANNQQNAPTRTKMSLQQQNLHLCYDSLIQGSHRQLFDLKIVSSANYISQGHFKLMFKPTVQK